MSTSSYVTIFNTVWIYPPSDVDVALATTTYSYTRVGNIIICPDMDTLTGIYTDIYNRTSITQPVGNVGYSLGVGSNLLDMGEDLYFQLPGGIDVIHWRLVRQVTPQAPLHVISAPGNSPNGTIGYVTVFTSWATGATPSGSFDDVLVVRTG